MHKQAGKIIGAAEGNKELKDRNGGFGAYDCPFLGPTGERTTKDASDEQVAALALHAALLACSWFAIMQWMS